MKKSIALIFSFMLLFMIGCKEKDENRVDKERVTEFDKIIVELQGAVKKDVTANIINGIYIKTSNRIETYGLTEINRLSFDEKLALILSMDKNSEVSYIVLNNSYVTWKNYKNIDNFSGAPSILDIIGVKTIVYNIIGKKEIYADGTSLPFVPVTGYVDNSKNYNYTRQVFPIGGNVDSPVDYSRANIFVDLIKTASVPASPTEPWLGSVQLDENGWPMEDFGIMLMRDQTNIENGGIYTISFECSVIPTVKVIHSSGTVSILERDESSGIIRGTVTIPKQQQLFMSFTKTNGGVRNLKVLRPGYTEKNTFTKEYLDHMNRFNTIRTMDMTLTNGNEQKNWRDRQKPTDGPHNYKLKTGVAWEYCIELANTVKADLWINVPHMADEEYIRNLANLIKTQLNPDLNVYIEYSNENWNWIMPQSFWTLDEANKEPNLSKLKYDGQTNKYYLHWRFIGEKIKQCSDIFGEVWGKDEINKRVRPVLAAQIAYDITFQQPLQYLKDVYGDPEKYIYGVAGAPYFNMGEELQHASGVTVDQIISGFDKSVDETTKYIEMLRNFAKEYGVKMLAYEGGSDTYAPGGGSIDEKEASNSDPRIKPIIIKYLENWYYAGGELFCWYLAGATSWHSQYGSFGLINTPGQETGPKLEAVDDIIAGGFSKYASGQISTENPKMDLNTATKEIDFESLIDSGINNSIGNSVSLSGYDFTGTSGLISVKEKGLSYTTPFNSIVLQGYSWGSIMRILKTDKKPFSIKSMKLIRPFNTTQASSVKITVYFHTRGSAQITVNIPLETGRIGYTYVFPQEWAETGMKEVKFEFMEGEDGSGVSRYGAIDDVVIYDVVK